MKTKPPLARPDGRTGLLGEAVEDSTESLGSQYVNGIRARWNAKPQYGAGLGPNLNHCTIGHSTPDFIHFLICDGNAAVRPILRTMSAANPAEAIRQSVDVDVAARRDAASCRASPILRVGIGDVNGTVELAVGISAIKDVDAFRRSMVALLSLWANRVASQSDLVRL
jgi:hypothetical protein